MKAYREFGRKNRKIQWTSRKIGLIYLGFSPITYYCKEYEGQYHSPAVLSLPKENLKLKDEK